MSWALSRRAGVLGTLVVGSALLLYPSWGDPNSCQPFLLSERPYCLFRCEGALSCAGSGVARRPSSTDQGLCYSWWCQHKVDHRRRVPESQAPSVPFSLSFHLTPLLHDGICRLSLFAATSSAVRWSCAADVRCDATGLKQRSGKCCRAGSSRRLSRPRHLCCLCVTRQSGSNCLVDFRSHLWSAPLPSPSCGSACGFISCKPLSWAFSSCKCRKEYCLNAWLKHLSGSPRGQTCWTSSFPSIPCVGAPEGPLKLAIKHAGEAFNDKTVAQRLVSRTCRGTFIFSPRIFLMAKRMSHHSLKLFSRINAWRELKLSIDWEIHTLISRLASCSSCVEWRLSLANPHLLFFTARIVTTFSLVVCSWYQHQTVACPYRRAGVLGTLVVGSALLLYPSCGDANSCLHLTLVRPSFQTSVRTSSLLVVWFVHGCRFSTFWLSCWSNARCMGMTLRKSGFLVSCISVVIVAHAPWRAKQLWIQKNMFTCAHTLAGCMLEDKDRRDGWHGLDRRVIFRTDLNPFSIKHAAKQ